MTNSSECNWPLPRPIPTVLQEVQSFDADLLLPSALRKWAKDVADRMQCPIDYIAVGVLVALSSLVCRKCVIKPKRFDSFQIYPILWGIIVGRPGVMKSPALSQTQKFLEEFIIRANSEYEIASREFMADQKLIKFGESNSEKEIKKLLKIGDKLSAKKLLMNVDGISDKAPVMRRYLVNDTSVEALAEIMLENPLGFLVYRDELSGLLESLDKEGQQSARSFYLQGYDGDQSYTVDRIGRGYNRHIEAVGFALLGGMQPGKIKSYVRQSMTEGSKDDGLMQRFGLLVWPDISKKWRNVDRLPDVDAENEISEIFSLFDEMQTDMDPDSGKKTPRVYRFSEDAQDAYDDSRSELEHELRNNDYPPAVESHFSKYRKLIPALGLIFALINRESEVSKSSLCMALEWSDYLRSHVMRAYSAGAAIKADGALALLAKIKAGEVLDQFKPSDIYLKGWANLGSSDVVREALELLVELGHLRPERRLPSSQGGRPSVIYHIHPTYLRG